MVGQGRLCTTLEARLRKRARDLGSNSLDRARTGDRGASQAPVVADPIGVRPEGGTGYAPIPLSER
jgi:hypothetical protein